MSDKENRRPKSRIPVAKRTRNKLVSSSTSIGAVRDPLKEISNENVGQNIIAGSSRDIPVNAPKLQKEELEVFGGTANVARSGIPRPLASAKSESQAKSSRTDHPAAEDLVIDPLNKHYALENLNYLVQVESKMDKTPKLQTASRANIVNWIIKFETYSIHPATVQKACWYLDKYLSSAVVTKPRLKVTAAACLWIATKLFGDYKPSKSFVEYSRHEFDENELRSAEINILQKLNFQAPSVVPQDLIPYFSWRCGWVHRDHVKVAATFICLCGLITDKTFINEYPSVVAAAAVNVSLKCLQMTSCMERLESSPIYQATIKKTTNLSGLCNQLNTAISVIRSNRYQYQALVCKYNKPPNFIVSKIFRSL